MSLSLPAFPRNLLERSFPVALLLALTSGVVEAQSVNIDIEGVAGASTLPPNTFGGVPGQFGAWNSYRPATIGDPFVAIDGTLTQVTMSVSLSPGTGFSSYTGGFSGALEGDFFEAGNIQAPGYADFSLTGLTQGTYDVYTYAGLWNCGHPNTVSIVSPGSSDPPQLTEGSARHRVVVTSSPIVVRIAPNAWCIPYGYMLDCMGIQIVKFAEPTTICAGDGTATACPCANSGGAGRGCATSFEPLGALLSSSGIARVSSDSFTLSAGGVSDAGATFFQGSDAYGGGAGIAFADGLLCSGGTIVRLATRFASGAQVSYPLVGDTPISTLGGPQAVGSQRIYQLWYRDSAPGFCTSATFNLTNGVRTVWAP